MQKTLNLSIGAEGLWLWVSAPLGWAFHRRLLIPWTNVRIVQVSGQQTHLELAGVPAEVLGVRAAQEFSRRMAA